MPVSPSPPTIADVARIAALEDGVLRNLRITQCYHALAVALRERLGGDLNWCGFAQWASKQAGQTIRHQDLQRILSERIHRSAETRELRERVVRLWRRRAWGADVARLRRALEEELVRGTALERASGAIGRGNLKVFAEIGLEFARFLATFRSATSRVESDIQRFCGSLRAGPSPEGQDRLRSAFESYHRALFEPSAKMRAELVLFANLQVGFHEQRRLQPEIQEALDAPLADARSLRRQVFQSLHPERGEPGWLRRLILFGTSSIDRHLERLSGVTREATRRLITEVAMSLHLPGEVVRLGQEIERRLPPSLVRITHGGLALLIEEIEDAAPGRSGHGADDWADFGHRMKFIARLFHAYQDAAPLWTPPFDNVQTEAIAQGKIPLGPL